MQKAETQNPAPSAFARIISALFQLVMVSFIVGSNIYYTYYTYLVFRDSDSCTGDDNTWVKVVWWACGFTVFVVLLGVMFLYIVYYASLISMARYVYDPAQAESIPTSHGKKEMIRRVYEYHNGFYSINLSIFLDLVVIGLIFTGFVIRTSRTSIGVCTAQGAVDANVVVSSIMALVAWLIVISRHLWIYRTGHPYHTRRAAESLYGMPEMPSDEIQQQYVDSDPQPPSYKVGV